LGIDYVVVGPAELEHLGVNEASFANSYPLVINHAGYRVYRVKN
jgi:hypothetical protein